MSQMVTDQMGQTVVVPDRPQRIISLVPSQTELLFDLGLDQEIIGVTRFCIHPAEKVAGKLRIGGTKNLDVELIRSLDPDLIIGNKEENYKEGIIELMKYFPVWMSDVNKLDDFYAMTKAIGQITAKQMEAEAVINEIRQGFNSLPSFPYNGHQPSVAYFIWRKPYMVAASDTFIDHMLGVLGLNNAFGRMARYPVLSAEQIAECGPDLIFLSSEPYSFNESHIEELKYICPSSEVVIVDGELFSWYGSRLKHTAAYFDWLRNQLFLSK